MVQTNAESTGLLKYQTLNDIVYEAIRGKIASLIIRPGGQLVEQQLALELGVSKSPVREAFRRLEKTGLITVIPFKGCFASPLSLKEFREAVEFREELEVYSLSVGLARYTNDDVREIQKLERAAEKQLKRGDRKAASDLHSKVHKLIVKKGGNTIIERTFTDLLDNTLRRYLIIALEEVSVWGDRWAQQHHQLFAAIEKRDVPGAISVIREHVRGIFSDSVTSEVIQRYESRAG
jgi:DNA-binding GntR family transcriptional regulator